MGNCSSAREEYITRQPALKFEEFRITQRYRALKEIPTMLNDYSVFLVQNIITEEKKIMKKYKLAKKKDSLNDMYELINIYEDLKHPQIINIEEAFLTATEAQLIYPTAPGTMLLKYFSKMENIDEGSLGTVMFQLLTLLNYIHHKNVCVRSLDPYNIFFDGKLIYLVSLDFAKYRRSKRFDGMIGKPFLVSPEMATGNYSRANDLWQAGVIFHLIATGYPVIEGNTYGEIKDKVVRKDFDIDKFKIMLLDNRLKDVVERALIPDPDERPKVSDLLKMPYFEEVVKKGNQFTRHSIFKNKLDGFVFKSNFHRALHHYFVHKTTSDDEKREATRAFTQIDKDGNGKLSASEIEMVLEQQNEPDAKAKIKVIFERLNIGPGDEIPYMDFLDLWIQSKTAYSEQNLQTMFRGIDRNGDGSITEEELEQIFGKQVNEIQYQKIIRKFTKNNRIDYQNFVKMVQEIISIQS